jgi:CheY-like chemotaxis protein
MGTRILLADDSITIQKVVNLTFADEGIEVIAVSNGDVAERRLEEVKPDLVLADIFMPGKNGYELCDAIKQNAQFRNVPVVLLVGAFEPFDQAEARRVRADAHLTKPFESRTLVETVRRLTKSSGLAAGPLASLPEFDTREESREKTEESYPSPLDSSRVPVLDLSAMSHGLETSPVAASRTTEELASSAHAGGAEDFDFAVIELPRRETETTIVAPNHNQFDMVEDSFEQPGADIQEMTLDFDHSEALEAAAIESTTSIQQPTIHVDIEGEAEEWQEHKVLETARLDSLETGWERAADSAFEPARAQFDAHDNSADAAGAMNEPSGSTLLAVDEPLGDVLLDEADLAHAYSANSSEPLSAPDRIDESRTEETQFDFEPSVTATDEHLNWTSSRAGVYSTAQLDSVVMPEASADYLAEKSFDESKENGHLSFASSSTWSEVEARFTPIDIEAVAVEESEITPSVNKPETGFAFSSDTLDHSAELESFSAVQASSNAGPSSSSAGATRTPELSPGAIEEIVRRVIAEMSDSVVREVAWEVVPDCVERVIGQLTRESLSREAQIKSL